MPYKIMNTHGIFTELCVVSELGLLIQKNNITWAQVEAYLKGKGTDASIISSVHNAFEQETENISGNKRTIDIGSDGKSIYDSAYDNTSLEDADNIFQEADPTQRQNGNNTDIVSISQRDKDILMDAINGLTGGNEPKEKGGTEAPQTTPQPYYPQINFDSTPFNYGSITFDNPFGMYAAPDINSFSIQMPRFDFSTGTTYGNNNNFGTINFDYTPYTPNYNQQPSFTYNFGDTFLDSPFLNYPPFDYNNPVPVTPTPPNGNNTTPIQPNGTEETTHENAEIPHGQNNTKPEETTEYPKEVQKLIEGLTSEDAKYTVEQDKKGFTVTVTSAKALDSIGANSITYRFDKKGKLRTQINEYKNGTTLKSNHRNKTNVLYDSDIDERFVTIAENLASGTSVANKNILEHNDSSTYTLTQTEFDDENITKIVTTLNKKPWQANEGESADFASDEDYIQKQVITFKDGHEETIIYEKGEIKSHETTRSLEQIEEEKGEPIPQKLRTPVEISFDLPSDANNDCREFANALCSEKERLMNELGLDNDTYNELAQTAMAIAEKETQMNKIGITNRLYWKNKLHEAISDYRGGDQNCSTGIAQIKLGQWYNNPPKNEEQRRLQPFFENAGITTPEDLKDNRKAAIATIIALSSINRELNADIYKKGVEKAQQLTVTREGWELDNNGIARQTGHTRPWKNEITKQDQLLLLWNNKSGRKILASGTFKPQTKDFMYMNVARKANIKYKLVEDPESRKLAEEKEKELLIRDEQTKPYKDMTLNGPMGEVIFMPGMYKNNSQFVNSEQEIEKLKRKLKEQGISEDLINELTTALKNKELGFAHGLTNAEIEGMTKVDIQLLLKHLNNIKEQIHNIKTSDGISNEEAKNLRDNYGAAISQAEDAFRQEYLTNHSPVYNATKTNPKILRGFSDVSNDNNYVISNGERKGFQHEKARGVNVNTTNGRIRDVDEVLAKSGYKVVSENPTNNDTGFCLTGVKQAMKDAGIDLSGMEEKGNTPKYVKNWFDEMVTKGVFTKVEYVAVDDTHAREINQSDIMRLPAGYFVLFVPDPNGDFKEQAGHIAITNGYGQGYADATDNLAWAQFSNNKSDSGKGENGKFYIYKLSDKWSVDATTGKLKFNG